MASANVSGRHHQKVNIYLEMMHKMMNDTVSGCFLPKPRRGMSSESIHSAYEVNEDKYVVTCSDAFPQESLEHENSIYGIELSPQTTFDTVSPISLNSDLLGHTTNDTYFILESSESNKNLRAKARINKCSKPLKELKIKCPDPLKCHMSLTKDAQPKYDVMRVDISFPKLVSEHDRVLSHDRKRYHIHEKKTAQVVHDLVLQKYENSYKQLVQKVKNTKLSSHENKCCKVIESRIQKQNKTKIYSSGDSDNALVTKHIGRGYAEQTSTHVKGDPRSKMEAQALASNVLNTIQVKAQVHACANKVNDDKGQAIMPHRNRGPEIDIDNPHQRTSTSGSIEFPTSNQKRNSILQRSESDFDEEKFIQNASGEELLRRDSSEPHQRTSTSGSIEFPTSNQKRNSILQRSESDFDGDKFIQNSIGEKLLRRDSSEPHQRTSTSGSIKFPASNQKRNLILERSESDFDEEKFIQNAIGEELLRRDSSEPHHGTSTSGSIKFPASNQKGSSILQSSESGFDEAKFIQNASGEELLRRDYSEESTVGTDDASALISFNYALAALRIHRCELTQSLLAYNDETISDIEIIEQKNIDPCTPSDEDEEPSYFTYENIPTSMDVYGNSAKLQIKKHIWINERIIEKTKKMLDYGLQRTRNFIGSHTHLEWERILLISKIRRYALLTRLHRTPETPSETTARLTIANINCVLDTPQESQYYVCILQHETIVWSTEIATSNKVGWVEFGGLFIFDNINKNFNIPIRLYRIHIPMHSQVCFSLPCLCSPIVVPTMELAGEVFIDMLNFKKKEFILKKNDSINREEDKLVISIEVEMNWPETLRAFLTIAMEKGNHHPVWNRRWCILEEAKLSYYNYPSDEKFGSPFGIINFQFCQRYEESDIKYLNKRTFRLFLGDEPNLKILLICPDTDPEYELLSKNFTTILVLIKEWNLSKKA